jgi:hypothetical protein
MGLWAVSLMILFHDCRHTAATIMLSHGIPPVIVAGITCLNFWQMLGHSTSIRYINYPHFVPTMSGQAAQLMDKTLISIPWTWKRKAQLNQKNVGLSDGNHHPQTNLPTYSYFSDIFSVSRNNCSKRSASTSTATRTGAPLSLANVRPLSPHSSSMTVRFQVSKVASELSERIAAASGSQR